MFAYSLVHIVCKTAHYRRSCRPATFSQPPPRNIIAMISYYYTVSEPKAVRLSLNIVSVWKICVHYYQHTAGRKNKLMQADSTDKEFWTPNLPNLYDMEEDVLAKGTEFCELVENVVRCRRALRTHPSNLPLVVTAADIPRQLQTERRAARVVQSRIQCRRLQRRLEAQRVQKKHRAVWQTLLRFISHIFTAAHF